jgi:6-phosphogluconolactonase (cycloisomerase 2 family)
MLYQSAGPKLSRFEVDVQGATLVERESIVLPSPIQYAWQHPSGRFLYVSTSDRQKIHRLCAFRIATDGVLSQLGEHIVLATRPIHNSVDASGNFAFVCYSEPANLSVFHLNVDGTIGALIEQAAKLDMGVFPHQIRTTPSNSAVVLVTRGIDATATKPEDPGALKVLRFDNGQLTPMQDIQVGGRGGLGYGPRHLDFHPRKPWVYVSLERQNLLQMHLREGEGLKREPSFSKKSAIGEYPSGQQLAGAIHVHPKGHVLYIANRANRTVEFNGQQVFRGGENNIAVCTIDQTTGEPTLVQHADAFGHYVRCFAMDPDARLMVAATTGDMLIREGETVRKVSAGLALYRIADSGRLTFVRKYEVQLASGTEQLWVGMMSPPA